MVGQQSEFGPAINLAFYPLLLAGLGELFQQNLTTWTSGVTNPEPITIELTCYLFPPRSLENLRAGVVNMNFKRMIDDLIQQLCLISYPMILG